MSHLPSTPYDKTVDRMSINPTAQSFEKFVSGMYLGEITRLVLLSLVNASKPPSPSEVGTSPKKSLLFGGRGNEVINKMWAIDSSFMSEVEEAWEAGSRSKEALT